MNTRITKLTLGAHYPEHPNQFKKNIEKNDPTGNRARDRQCPAKNRLIILVITVSILLYFEYDRACENL